MRTSTHLHHRQIFVVIRMGGDIPTAQDHSARCNLGGSPPCRVSAPRYSRRVLIGLAPYSFFLSFQAHAVTTRWQNLAGGTFTDPFNWTSGVPDGNDIALFNLGSASYEVVFPTSSIFNPPPNFSILDFIVATNEVSFVYNFFPLQNPPSLTVLDPLFPVVIGESPGDVAILNMGLGRLSAANATIGALAGASGTLNVNSGTFSLSGPLHIGDAGTGTLNVTSGGRVESQAANLGHLDNPDHLADSVGFATVSGAGATWTVANALTVGHGGVARLDILAGGRVESFAGVIGNLDSGTGGAIVSGAGSTWTNSGNLTVGNRGSGYLEIHPGGAVSSNTATIGAAAGDNFPFSGGSVLVSGAGATWTISGALNVGSGNTGSLIIDAGGSVSCGDGFIGNNEFAVNTLASAEVKGAGSTWTLERLRIGGLLGRAGTLEIEDRGTVSVDQSIEIKTGGRLEFLGGTLDAQSISFEGFGAFFWQTGTLHVGNYDGYLTNSAGTLAPGHSAGQTIVQDDYTQGEAGTLEIEIGGSEQGGQHDFVNVIGNALVDGQLDLRLVNGFQPAPAQTFVIFDSASLLGVFKNAASGQRVTTTDGAGSFLVHYGPGSAFNPNQIVLSAFEAVTGLPGDYNQNGVVDAADYVVWRDNEGTTNMLPNDSIGGEIGAAHYNQWRAYFGQSAASGAALGRPSREVVPEPRCLFLVCLGVGGLLAIRRSC